MEGQAVMIQITTVSVCLVAFMCLLFWVRYYYQKKATTNLLCLVRTKEGGSYREMLPVIGGTIDVQPIKDKKGRTLRSGKKFVVKDLEPKRKTKKEETDKREISTLPQIAVDYPENFPKILQTKAQMIILDEEDIIPWARQSENGREAISPEILSNLFNEQFTSIMVAHSDEIAELEAQLRNPSRLNKLQWGLIAIGGGLVAIGAFLYMNLTKIIEGINIIRAGLGV